MPELDEFLLDLFALEGDAEGQLDWLLRYRPVDMDGSEWDRGVSQVRHGSGCCACRTPAADCWCLHLGAEISSSPASWPRHHPTATPSSGPGAAPALTTVPLTPPLRRR